MSHKRKPSDPAPLRMDQTQNFKTQKIKEITQLRKAIDTEYASEQTHLKSIYNDKKNLGIVRGLLKDLDAVEGGTISRLVYGNYIFPLPKSVADKSMKDEQQMFLDRIHTFEVQMRCSVQKQRELRKRLDVLMVEYNKLDVDVNYKFG